MKFRFTTETLSDYESRAVLILRDPDLDDHTRKILLNRVRMDCMKQYSFYSQEMQSFDDFIRAEILQIEMEQSQGHRNRSASVIAS